MGPEGGVVSEPHPARLGLIAKSDFAGYFAHFCIDAAMDIVSTYQELSFAQPDFDKAIQDLTQRLRPECVEADFAENVEGLRRVQALSNWEHFDHALFVEVLCYVVACADFLLQGRRDREVYLEARGRLQPCLYQILRSTLAFRRDRIEETDGMIVERAEVYCADLATSSDMLMAYLPADSVADPLGFSQAAYAYLVVAVKNMLLTVLIDESVLPGRYEFRCPDCSKPVRGVSERFRITARCTHCGSSFEILPVPTQAGAW